MPAPGRWLLGGAAAFLALAVAAELRSRPPAPRPADAEGFSALRAVERLRRVLGPGEPPHPVGSRENARVRRRIVEELRALGVDASERAAFACSPSGICAPVVNVLATIPGGPGSVLLSCHHDSVPAGPGAADDGAGVATLLEIASLLAESSPRHTLKLLFADGEEAGLLGARAFVRSPDAGDVRLVINVEARGTTGAVAMFETSEPSAGPVALFAGGSPRPVGSSLLYGLYRLLPNDTDLTVYKEAGLAGLNFAFADGLPRYHTPRDELAHLDPGSVQHMGDLVLGCLRAVDSRGIPEATGDTVYADALATFVVRWPAGASLPMSIAVAVTALLLCGRWCRRGETRPAEVLWGLLAFLSVPPLAALGGAALALLLPWLRGIPDPFAARPEAAILAVDGAAAVAALLPAHVLGRRARPLGLLAAAGCANAVLAVATAALAPAASYLFLVPASLAIVPALLWRTRVAGAAILAAALSAAVPWLGLHRALAVMVGPALGTALAVPFAMALVPLAPLLASAGPRPSRGTLAAAGAATIVALGWALRVPAFTPEAPQPVNLLYLQDDASASWIVRARGGPVPAALARAPGMAERRRGLYPWSPSDTTLTCADAPRVAMPAPALDVVTQDAAGTRRTVTARLRSPRGASSIYLCFPEASGAVVRSMGGEALSPNSARARARHPGWIVHGWRGLGPEGIDVVLDLPTGAVDLVLQDARPGLPPGGEALAAARPAEAAPIQDGDETLRRADVRIEASGAASGAP